MLLASGTRLGSYEILAPLGAGGMGEVYRAKDTRLGRDIAVKVLPEALASQPERLARFEREARAIASLNHPNVVVIHSIEADQGVRFLTMEFVDGRTLDGVAGANGLPLARTLDIAIPLAGALVAAHERGIVHRDLKPANVMVTSDGRVKVLDFGLAKLASPEADVAETEAHTAATPISTMGQVMGTVPYMAPEQVRGEAVDARTDLFSFGVLLYELLTGRRPFTGATSADICSAILRDPPAPALRERPDLPPDVERIVGRCLEKDPSRRIQTARDVRGALEALRVPLSAGALPAAPPRAMPRSDAELASIAVLPFVNRSRDEGDTYFADGLADELLGVLAKIRGLRVAARTSSFHFKGRNEEVAVIGEKLNVATLLEGSVRKAGDRVRISVQLIKVSDGFHLWSETYDRTLDDIFDVQDDIAQSVVKELRTTLLGEEPNSRASGEVRAEVAAAGRGRGESGEAHRLVLQGRNLIERLSREDVVRGLEYLKQAVQLEPGNARAWALRSWGLCAGTGLGYFPVEAASTEAHEYAERALALEPDMAEGHLALGTLMLFLDWDWAGAESSLGRALELAPGSAEVLRMSAMLAYVLGRLDAALALAQRSIDQDPLNAWGHAQLSRALRSQGRYAEGEQALRKSLELSPSGGSFHAMLSIVLSEQGQFDAALDMAGGDPEEWSRLWALAMIHQAAGQGDDASRMLLALIERHAATSPFQIAQVFACRGETDQAFEWLERSYEQRDSGLALLRPARAFERLHGDPRWAAFLRKMGFTD